MRATQTSAISRNPFAMLTGRALTACKAIALWLCFLPAVATAAIVNVEFNFAPYTGNPDKEDVIVFVRGEARLFINGLPFAEVDVKEQKYKIIFSDREISSAPVSISGNSFGPLLLKGRNALRVEFSPADPKRTYTAELAWAAVTDGVTETRDAKGTVTSTNLAQKGRDRRTAEGRVVLEREFDADFATDRPWHRYPPVKALSETDKQQIRALAAQRLQALEPDFKAFYGWLERQNVQVADVRRDRVLEKIHASRLRVKMADAAKLELVAGSGPGVMVRAVGGEPLYKPDNPQVLAKVADKSAQEFAMAVLPRFFPPRLVVARTPAGVWEIAD